MEHSLFINMQTIFYKYIYKDIDMEVNKKIISDFVKKVKKRKYTNLMNFL